MFWGITPCLNLLDGIDPLPESLNILLIGSSDLRHILKTLSKRKAGKTQINFYIIEAVPEVVAKQILLLTIALQKVQDVGLVPKARIFMESFGNSLVRPVTAKYLAGRSVELVKMITDYEYLRSKIGCLSLDLKYKERDYIENVFKFWGGIDQFDILLCWDRRLRKSLGVRYDTRNGVFDWDLHMRLHSIGGNQICSQEYQSFRRNGVAFTWLESEVTKPNRTMVTGLIPNGPSFAHYGYLGDMVTGPFVSYGISCEDEEYSKKSNNKNKYRASDVTERNLRQIFWELEFGEEYVHQNSSELALGSCIAQLSDNKVVDVNNVEAPTTKTTNYFELRDATINFLSLSSLKLMSYKEKYKSFFDLVYFGQNCVKYFDRDVVEFVGRGECRLIFEHRLFILSHRDKELEEHRKDVMEKIGEMKVEPVDSFDVKKDFYMKFKMKNTSD